MLPRSSVSYQFQAVLTAFYCAATPEGHGYLSVSPDTSRSNAVPSRCLYAEHYSRRSNGDTLRGVFVFGFQGSRLCSCTAASAGDLLRTFVGWLCLSCLVWLQCKRSHMESQALFRIFFTVWHLAQVEWSTVVQVVTCVAAHTHTRTRVGRETAVKASRRLCKAFYRRGG